MSELELYQGLADRDDAAFRILYRDQFDTIKHLIRQKGGTDDDASDVFQEGVIALWTNIKQGKFEYRPNVKISTYLYSVCHRLWLKRIRDEKKHVSLDQQTVEPYEEAELPGSDLQDEAVLKLRTIFSNLGVKCQKILKMFYYEKLSMKDIAQTMDYEINTAKNEKYRCMKKIRSTYQAQ